MKTKIIFSAMILASLFAATGCNSSTGKKDSEKIQQEVKNIQYTCTMHPEVIQDKPGNCPKCGMALVEKKAEMETEHSHEEHSR